MAFSFGSLFYRSRAREEPKSDWPPFPRGVHRPVLFVGPFWGHLCVGGFGRVPSQPARSIRPSQVCLPVSVCGSARACLGKCVRSCLLRRKIGRSVGSRRPGETLHPPPFFSRCPAGDAGGGLEVLLGGWRGYAVCAYVRVAARGVGGTDRRPTNQPIARGRPPHETHGMAVMGCAGRRQSVRESVRRRSSLPLPLLAGRASTPTPASRRGVEHA